MGTIVDTSKTGLAGFYADNLLYFAMSYRQGPPPDVSGMVSLKVDNLTYRTNLEDLRRAFERYGDVGDAYIPRDRFTRESRGFAFVRFHDKRDAEDAMDAMDGAMMDGRQLRVQMVRYGRPTENYRPRGDRRRGSRRSYSRSRSRSRDRGGRRGGGRRSPSRSRSRSSSRSRSPRDSRSRSRDRGAKDSPDKHNGDRRSDERSRSRSRSRDRD